MQDAARKTAKMHRIDSFLEVIVCRIVRLPLEKSFPVLQPIVCTFGLDNRLQIERKSVT